MTVGTPPHPTPCGTRGGPEAAGPLSVAGPPRTLPVSPALHQLDRGGAQDAVGQQVDLLHDVGEAHGQLLPQEGEGGLLTGIAGAWGDTGGDTG